jgi:hypothetical protein
MDIPSERYMLRIKWKESPEPINYGPYDSYVRAYRVLKAKLEPATAKESLETWSIFEAIWSEMARLA